MGCSGSKAAEETRNAPSDVKSQPAPIASTRKKGSEDPPVARDKQGSKQQVASSPAQNAASASGSNVTEANEIPLEVLEDAFARASLENGCHLASVAELSAALRILKVPLDGVDVDALFEAAMSSESALDLSAFILLVNRPEVEGALRVGGTASTATSFAKVPQSDAAGAPAAVLSQPPSAVQFDVTAEHLMAFGKALEAATDDGFVRTAPQLQAALAALGKDVDAVEAEVLFGIADVEVYEAGAEACVGLREFATLCAKIGLNPLDDARPAEQERI